MFIRIVTDFLLLDLEKPGTFGFPNRILKDTGREPLERHSRENRDYRILSIS